jgi:tetratricopeptide (TPR) repeat protein
MGALAQSPAPLVEVEGVTPGSIDFSNDQFTPIRSEDQKKADEVFNKVYEKPDSLPLNLQLALAQLQIGNLKGAAATLDRILALYPGQAQAQLLLGQTESRLGNTFEAKAYFQEVLDNPNATPLQKEAATKEMAVVIENEKLWKYSGMLQAGIGRSMNPLNSSKYLTILGFDLGNPSYDASFATTYMYFASLSFERSLETQSNDSIVLTMSRFNQQYQNSNPEINYGLANLGINTATLAYQSGNITDRLTVGWNSSQTTLSNKGFINSNWGSASYQKAVGENALVNAGVSYGFNNQLEGENYSGSSSRSNWMTGLTLNGKYFISTNWLAEVNLARYNYLAKVGYESYFMNYELGSLSYLSNYGIVGIFASNINNQYADVDPLSGSQRQIQTATYGASVTIALPTLKKPDRKDLTLSLTYQQGQSNSNVQTYNTQSRQYMAILSKGF